MNTELAAVNAEIWLPFRESYATRRLDLFASVLAPDFVRIERSAGWIGPRDEYLERVGAGFAKAAERADQLAIEFRFTERMVRGDLAYERGVYRVTITDPHATVQAFHGRFDAVHRRLLDGWRMLVDQDDDRGVDPGDYEAAIPLGDLAPFTSN